MSNLYGFDVIYNYIGAEQLQRTIIGANTAPPWATSHLLRKIAFKIKIFISRYMKDPKIFQLLKNKT